MPRIKEKRFEYAAEDMVKRVHGELLAEGIHDAEVGTWLGCSGQNVSRHFREASFSVRQWTTIVGRLEEIRAEARQLRGKEDRDVALVLIDMTTKAVADSMSPNRQHADIDGREVSGL